MTFGTRLDAIDTRVVLRAYAAAAVSLGLILTAWGQMWLGSSLGPYTWGKAVIIRMAGAVVVAAGLSGWALSLGDWTARQRGLRWFTGAHVAVLAVFVAQIRGPLQDPVATQAAWTILAVILGLTYVVVHRPGASGPATQGRLSIEETRTRYEQQIREAAAQEERHRLARDLHDAVKQQIFAMQTAAAAAEARLIPDPDGAREAIVQVRQSAREAMTEMEAMLDQLRTVPLENAGLVEAVRKAAEALAFRTGAKVNVQADELPPSGAFEPGAHEAIFRIIQEGLANVGRHARANNVLVRLRVRDGKLTAVIEDDGIGMTSEATGAGMGIQNMRTRAQQAGGQLTIAARGGGGTRVTLQIPYETGAALRSSRRRALLLAIMFGSAAAGGLVRLISEGFALANAFLVFYSVATAHSVVTYRRLNRRLAAITGTVTHR